MRILVSNDDGIHAPGIEALEAALARVGEVWVVAPDRERSAVGQSISIHQPLRVRAAGARRWAVDGTPADCIYLALAELMPERPDVVVSGINLGVNLGEDVFYSGTVAAAKEAAFRNIPAFAISQDVHGFARGHGTLEEVPDLGAAAELAAGLAQALGAARPSGGAGAPALPPRTLLNVNVPNTPPLGVRAAPLGVRNYVLEVERRVDPRGRSYYWVGGSASRPADIPGSDCNLLAEGYVTVTPLRLDLTARDLLDTAGALAAAALVPRRA
ncbi:MAG TPA: 5'/3'-nucleotidase SurE [Myxococcota bacterium]|nr:5'/3'-nucleotidase SurE [Myxococcota bacterium]